MKATNKIKENVYTMFMPFKIKKAFQFLERLYPTSVELKGELSNFLIEDIRLIEKLFNFIK